MKITRPPLSPTWVPAATFLLLGSAGGITSPCPPVSAQIVGDNTLPTDSIVTLVGADSVVIDGQGQLTSIRSDVEAGAMGDSQGIFLQTRTRDIRDKGRISTTVSGTGNTGLIDITASDRLTIFSDGTFPLSDPDNVTSITAMGQNDGQGDVRGLQITTGVLDLQNGGAIDASFGLTGTVDINTPAIDPASRLVELPDQVRDPSDQVVQGCAAATGNSFTVSG